MSPCHLCARVHKGVLPHLYPLFIFFADDVSTAAQHGVAPSCAVVLEYSAFPAVKNPAFAYFVILEQFPLTFRALDRQH
jgi:hypothetical protein